MRKMNIPFLGYRTYAQSMYRIHAARYASRLFSALVLVDPVIFPAPIEPGMKWADGWGAAEALVALCNGAVTRRNGWKSKYAYSSPPEPTLIRCLVSGQKHWSHSKRIPFFLLGIHFHLNCTLIANSGRIRKPEKPS